MISDMHLGHILSSDLSDSDNLDIIAVKQGMCCKANLMLIIFRPCDPYAKTKLMQRFYLSLYGASLWMASSPEIRSLETAYNNLLRRIWNLPRHCHSYSSPCCWSQQYSYNYNMIIMDHLLQKAGCLSQKSWVSTSKRCFFGSLTLV